MLRYFLQRIFLAIPTLLLSSLVFFGLNQCAVDREQSFVSIDGTPVRQTLQQTVEAAKKTAAELGIDKPLFYFSLATAAQSDTLYRVFPVDTRLRLSRWSDALGDWPLVSQYHTQVFRFVEEAHGLPDTLPGVAVLQQAALDLLAVEQLDSLPVYLQQVTDLSVLPALAPLVGTAMTQLNTTAAALTQSPKNYKRWIPVLHWHGPNNQYHRWLSGFLRGDLGVSKLSRKPVGEALALPLRTTLLLNGVAIVLAYGIAVPLGVVMARRKGRFFDAWAKVLLLLLYAMPGFWTGGMLILLFGTPGFGWHLIPGVGIEKFAGSGKSFFQWAFSNYSQFVLPIAVLTIHALTVLALQMRGAMLDALEQDYIRTARAKGLSENKVYWRHAFRNALFPVITVFGGTFPALIGGSLVIDYLFELPGMGFKTHEAFMSGDISVLSSILMLLAILTVLGQLVADMLYVWADPRVRFKF